MLPVNIPRETKMSIYRSIITIISLPLLMIACTQADMTAAEIEKLEAEVMQATLDRNAAYAAGDPDLAFRFFSSATGALEIEDGNYRIISSETLEDMREFFGSAEVAFIDIGTPQIRILGRQSAMAFYEGNWSAVDKGTNEEIGSHFLMTLVWVNEDGKWKVFHKHESTPALKD